jgi:hypothetical protein
MGSDRFLPFIYTEASEDDRVNHVISLKITKGLDENIYDEQAHVTHICCGVVET